MSLTDDQKAMLRLLAQREEGYEDMAAVMGITVEELRSRVKEALSEVEEPDASAEPVEPPAPTPPPAPVEPPQAKAAEPTPPPPPAPEPPQPAARQPGGAPLSRLWTSKDRGALIGLGAGVLVVLALVIVLIVGGDGDSSSDTSSSGDDNANLTAAEESKFTQAVLEPASGGDASGRALFGRYKKNVLLQVEAEGLDSPPQGQSYTVWLYRSPKISLRLGAVTVSDAGKIATQLAIPSQLLSYVASGAFDQVDISLTSNAAYKAVLAQAKKEGALPPYTGESVLRGEITGPAIRGQ